MENSAPEAAPGPGERPRRAMSATLTAALQQLAPKPAPGRAACGVWQQYQLYSSRVRCLGEPPGAWRALETCQNEFPRCFDCALRRYVFFRGRTRWAHGPRGVRGDAQTPRTALDDVLGVFETL